MNNKIENKKDMNDKDVITSILSLEKSLVKDYAVCLTEASNNDLYNDYFDMFDDIINLQRNIYNLMYKKGWYQLEIVQDDKIEEKKLYFTNEITQIDDK